MRPAVGGTRRSAALIDADPASSKSEELANRPRATAKLIVRSWRDQPRWPKTTSSRLGRVRGHPRDCHRGQRRPVRRARIHRRSAGSTPDPLPGPGMTRPRSRWTTSPVTLARPAFAAQSCATAPGLRVRWCSGITSICGTWPHSASTSEAGSREGGGRPAGQPDVDQPVPWCTPDHQGRHRHRGGRTGERRPAPAQIAAIRARRERDGRGMRPRQSGTPGVFGRDDLEILLGEDLRMAETQFNRAAGTLGPAGSRKVAVGQCGAAPGGRSRPKRGSPPRSRVSRRSGTASRRSPSSERSNSGRRAASNVAHQPARRRLPTRCTGPPETCAMTLATRSASAPARAAPSARRWVGSAAAWQIEAVCRGRCTDAGTQPGPVRRRATQSVHEPHRCRTLGTQAGGRTNTPLPSTSSVQPSGGGPASDPVAPMSSSASSAVDQATSSSLSGGPATCQAAVAFTKSSCLPFGSLGPQLCSCMSEFHTHSSSPAGRCAGGAKPELNMNFSSLGGTG